ncbi:cold-shock protein [Halorutilales archaeon Cl-col2-1]
MAEGTVKFFHNEKSYGFIEREDGDEDVFFHITEVLGAEIDEDDVVEFEIEEAEEGPRAIDVRRVATSDNE